MRWRLSWGLMLTLGLIVAAHAEIYNCTVNGVKTFSEQPCGADAKVVQTHGDRSVAFSTEMPPADIEYLCGLVLRAHDDIAADNSNGERHNAYYNPYWGNTYYQNYTDSRNREETYSGAQNFVLSHVSNLHELAHDNPDMYHYVVNLSSSRAYARINNDDERASQLTQCKRDVGSYLQREASSCERSGGCQ